ncbi:MAG: ImmA/IrrE family metallo-endopeptidase [Proteobacteria bacterium]|jgi:Zn-dependent peptidase ImmA (M78 family)|nr:ImmA/IrrE family metallo-endopeptidase [Pseudomonadota bacterium]
MLGRKERLQIAQRASGILRDSGALERIRDEGYTRVDPFKIAIDVDLAVMKRRLQGLLGGFFRNTQSGILVNIDRPPGMVHMTCAHELGHYFMGHETTVDQTLDYGPKGDTKEREADWFAYHLLMPRSLIVDVMRRKGWRLSDLKNPSTLYQLSLRLGTSFTATYWTLVSLEMLSAGPSEGDQLSRTSLQRLKHELAMSAPEQTLSDVWLLDENDRDRILEPRLQDRFIVDLPNHTSAGYLWSIDEIDDVGFRLKPLTVDVIATPKDGPLVVGGHGRQRYVLEHGIEQESDIPAERLALEFREAQPWRAHKTQHASFMLAAEFESMALGLDKQSQERLLAEITDA